MGKSKTTTSTSKLDPQAQAYRDKIYGAAQKAAGQPLTQFAGPEVAGVNGLSTDAAAGYRKGGSLFGLGVDAMGGNQEAFSKFFNPYQDNVLNAVQRQTGEAARHARMDIGDEATLASAFGGDRHGVAEGVATGDIYKAGGDRMADLTYQGFNDANARAAQAANLGFGALGAGAGMGDYFRQIQQQQLDANKNKFNEARDWGVRNLGILKSGMEGTPYGQTSTEKKPGSLLGDLAGIATTAGGFFLGGPAGAAAAYAGQGRGTV